MLHKNSPCWCGSGKKYKACHQKFDETLAMLRIQGQKVPRREMIKNPEDIKLMKKAGQINTGALDLVASKIHAGMSTGEIDDLVYEYTVKHGGIPAPLDYEGFPRSCCTSINEEVCHGIPDDNRILQDGDIVNVDCTTIYRGRYADSSRMFLIGNVSEEAKRLVEVTKECMEAGIAAIRPWGHLGDIGAAVQEIAHKNGYSVVVDYCGHGVGRDFHEDPVIHHVGVRGAGMVITPGMCFTVEPMINQGTAALYVDADNDWTAITEDGKLSAQWEKTIHVTDKGIEIIAS